MLCKQFYTKYENILKLYYNYVLQIPTENNNRLLNDTLYNNVKFLIQWCKIIEIIFKRNLIENLKNININYSTVFINIYKYLWEYKIFVSMF